MAPGSVFIIFAFAIYFLLHLFSDLLNQKSKNTLLKFILFDIRSINIYNSLPTTHRFWHRYRKGNDNPFNISGCRCCYLCAGAVYVVLLGSPTSSISLV